ncbi:MAG: 2-amino-4-hydroxy-6-hydroxymethyldihydropteridine diphosphokinase [Rhodospirillaceae bacterium]
MILVAVGSNLPAEGHASPLETCEAALNALEMHDIRIAKRSRWYRSAPVAASDQPDFVNGVVLVKSGLGPAPLLSLLHEIEDRFGRRRSVPNAARTLDLDLIDHDGVTGDGSAGPVLPHPRMAGRAFVLLPLAEVAPGWRHPVTGVGIGALIDALPPGQSCRPVEA